MIIIRCDSSDIIGSGHFARCNTLAEIFLQLGTPVVLFAKNLKGAHWHVLSSAIELVKIPSDLNQDEDAFFCKKWLNSNYKIPELIIVDNYDLDKSWESYFYKNQRVFVIDDLSNRKHLCDYLLDNGRISDEDAYKKLIPTECVTFFGPKYSIIRNEFLKSNPISVSFIKNVFVFFGGSDFNKETLRFIKDIQNINSDLYFHIVVSKGNSALDQIKNYSGKNFKIYIDPIVSEIMVKCDVYLGSGGSITWERMVLGLTGFVISVAPNQEEIAKNLSLKGLQIYLGSAREVNYRDAIDYIEKMNLATLKTMSENCKSLIGNIDATFCKSLIQSNNSKIKIRSAESADLKFLFELRNDSLVRSMSVNDKYIELTEHTEWFENFLKKKDHQLFVVEMDGASIGQFRIDSTGETSISLATPGRGKGLSTFIITESIKKFRARNSLVTEFYAVVKKNNIASKIAFQKAGFLLSEEYKIENEDYLRLILRIDE